MNIIQQSPFKKVSAKEFKGFSWIRRIYFLPEFVFSKLIKIDNSNELTMVKKFTNPRGLNRKIFKLDTEKYLN